MPKLTKDAPKAISANRLGDGVVVFLDEQGNWSESLNRATVATTPEHEQQILEIAKLSEKDNKVVEPYLFDVKYNGSHIVPTHIREFMRNQGPSVRKDLGKQAERKPSVAA